MTTSHAERVPDPAILDELMGARWGAQIYVQIPDRPRPLRFTKYSNRWKRTDGFAPPGTWITHQALAVLGTIVPPPFQKGTPND